MKEAEPFVDDDAENLLSLLKNEDSEFHKLKVSTEKTILQLLDEVRSCTEFDAKALQQVASDLRKAKNLLRSLKKHKDVEKLKVGFN